MEENATARLSTALRWLLAAVMPSGAAISYLLHMANGMAAGDMIGIAGREQDVAVALRYARYWLAAFWGFQAGVVVSLFALLRFGADAARLVRHISRGFVAVLLSVPVTLCFGIALYEILRLLHPHIG